MSLVLFPPLLALLAGGAFQEAAAQSQQPVPTVEEEITVIATTRTGRIADDQAMRVEVLHREEIEEKLLMTPGDIVMMLNEMGGMRVQATSPSLGAASVRIQGMRGRYTRVLSDGLPLFGDVGGLGLLQIPPMDLGQVEVIKGTASALYGAGAMGGVVNLIARRPHDEPEREFLINRSTRGATDGVAYLAAPLGERWSASLLGGVHAQTLTDVNDDEWGDLPGYTRGILRPRVFWDDGKGRTLFGTVGVTLEDREGGTVDGAVLPAAGEAYVEALDTQRYDAGIVSQFLVGESYIVSARGAIVHQRHDHQFGQLVERDRHTTVFGEATIRGQAGRGTWVAGVAIERDEFSPQDVPTLAYTFTVPGVFGQYDVDLTSVLSLSGSARLDVHSEYGTFLSPRVSALVKGGAWTIRSSVGTGFFASTPLTEETEAAGLTRLSIADSLEAERGFGASVDVSRTDGPFSYIVTLFASRVTDPVHVERGTSYTMRNLTEATLNRGLELLGTLRHEPFSVTGTYTYVDARETVDGDRRQTALTPRHSAGAVAMWESEEAGRVGVEVYYTGEQRLEENPFRSRSAPYIVTGILVERRFGRWRLFVNGENLTNVRQTRWDPLIRPAQAIDGRWTVDAWAPLDGRTINGGVRLAF